MQIQLSNNIKQTDITEERVEICLFKKRFFFSLGKKSSQKNI